MSALPDVKLRALTYLPAALHAEVGMVVQRKNGAYYMGLEFGSITSQEFISPDKYATSWQVYWDEVANDYVRIPYTLPTARVVSTSSTAATIGLGDASFTVDPGLGWTLGTRVRATDNDDATNWMEGVVKSYDPLDGTVTITFDSSQGSGTLSNWSIGIAATPGRGLEIALATDVASINVPAPVLYIKTTGYNAEGVGSALYRRVSAEPSHGGKLQSADGVWWELDEVAPTLAMFGPTADGSTDDTAVFDTAIDYASSQSKILTIDTGDYSVDNVTLKSNAQIVFAPGARLIQPDAGTVTAGHVLVGTGTVDTASAVTLTANATTSSDSVSVSAGAESAFPAGAHVLVYDDDYVFTPAVAGRNQEVMIVASTSSGVVSFTRKLTTAFTTANSAKIAPLDPIQNVKISGAGTIICGLNRQYGVRLTYPVNCNISKCEVKRSRGGGSFVFQTGFNSHIRGVTARDGQSPGTGGTGYGVSFDESCVFCSVTDSYFENLRENTYTNRTRWCTFSSNMCTNMADTGWNTHGAGSDNNVCQNNVFRDCSQGVAVGWSGATRGDSHNLVKGNKIYRCTNGISLAGNATGPVTGLGNVAKGNEIRSCTSRGISASYQISGSIEDNTIHDSATMTDGIYIVAGCSNFEILKNNIKGISTNGASGIRVDAATDVMVAFNNVKGLSGTSPNAFYVPSGSTDVRVQFNTAMDPSTVSLTGAAVNTLNSWN